MNPIWRAYFFRWLEITKQFFLLNDSRNVVDDVNSYRASPLSTPPWGCYVCSKPWQIDMNHNLILMVSTVFFVCFAPIPHIFHLTWYMLTPLESFFVWLSGNWRGKERCWSVAARSATSAFTVSPAFPFPWCSHDLGDQQNIPLNHDRPGGNVQNAVRRIWEQRWAPVVLVSWLPKTQKTGPGFTGLEVLEMCAERWMLTLVIHAVENDNPSTNNWNLPFKCKESRWVTGRIQVDFRVQAEDIHGSNC